jgi:hypothetical protein
MKKIKNLAQRCCSLLLFIFTLHTATDAQTKNNNLNPSKQSWFTVPFKQVGNLIEIKASINGIVRTFILDNGAPMLVLNSAYIKSDSLSKKEAIQGQGSGGTIDNLHIDTIDQFEMKDIQLKDQRALVVNLTHLEQETHSIIYGLIGYEIYKNYDLLFDYKNKTITFIRAEKTNAFMYNKLSSSKFIEVPIIMNNHIAVVDCEMKHKLYKMGIDCGAESNLFDTNLISELQSNIKAMQSDELLGANASSTNISSGKIKRIKIGTRKFRNSITVFNSIAHLNQNSPIKIDGLIGYEILSKQKTLLSYSNKKLVFIK